jgi:hypothetical protein
MYRKLIKIFGDVFLQKRKKNYLKTPSSILMAKPVIIFKEKMNLIVRAGMVLIVVANVETNESAGYYRTVSLIFTPSPIN